MSNEIDNNNSILTYENTLNGTAAIKCSKIVGYLSSARALNWVLYTNEGETLYQSDEYLEFETWTFDLSSLSVVPGTEFYIKGVKGGFDIYCGKVFSYVPDSNATVYVAYDGIIDDEYDIKYKGVIPLTYSPNSDPYLKCSGISIDTNGTVFVSYGLFTLEDESIYTSDSNKHGDTWKLEFKDLSIASGTLFRVKAIVSGGSDVLCDVIMQYEPESLYYAKFEFQGLPNNHIFMYAGSKLYVAPTIINASDIVAYTTVDKVGKFKIYLLDGTKVCESDRKVEYETWIYDLSKLNLEEGTELRFKTEFPVYEVTVKELIRYTQNTATIYYEVTKDNDYQPYYYYRVVESSLKPPVVKCSSLSVVNSSYTITKFALRKDGSDLYVGGRVRKGKTWVLNLSDLSIISGTQFMLKANCIAGSDSTAYMMFEYDPTSNRTAKYTLDGNAFRTVMIYEGV